MSSAENKKYVSDVLGLFFEREYPLDIEKDVQAWLASEDRGDEKEAALFEMWNSIPAASASATASSSLKSVKEKLGMARTAKKVSLGRRLIQVAAAVVPVTLVAGAFLIYDGSRNIEMRNVATANNEITAIVLSDGSRVYINAGSSVEYPAEFDGQTRNINLTGEAVFEVASDKSRGFEVSAGNLVVRATGTKFNVKAYDNERSTFVTLIEGGVDVMTAGGRTVSLDPDSQLVMDNTSGQIDVNAIDASGSISWLNRSMEFCNATLQEIFDAMERSGIAHFDISNGAGRKFRDRYTVKFSGNETLTDMLEVLEAISDDLFVYTIEGKDVRIDVNSTKRNRHTTN